MYYSAVENDIVYSSSRRPTVGPSNSDGKVSLKVHHKKVTTAKASYREEEERGKKEYLRKHTSDKTDQNEKNLLHGIIVVQFFALPLSFLDPNFLSL